MGTLVVSRIIPRSSSFLRNFKLRNLQKFESMLPCGELRIANNGFRTCGAAFLHTFNIQDSNDFQERVIRSAVPVIVDFHATWCGPCKMLAPRLESVMNEFQDKVILAKVDIDENTDLALEYGVNAVPAVIGIKDGKVQDQFVGLQDEDKIKAFVSKVIGPQK